MKKYFSFIYLFSILIGINTFSVASHFMSSEENNINQYHLKKLGVFTKTNAVHITEYGKKPLKINEYRRLRLNIFMKGDIYAYFMELIQRAPKDDFINQFLIAPPFLHTEEWGNIQKKLKRGFYIQSETHGEAPDYFENLFLEAIRSDVIYSYFKNVFTGRRLEWNTYKMPYGYRAAQAQDQFRREGAILQFDFTPIDNNPSKFIVSTVCRIFPYERQIMSLKQYYLNVVYRQHQMFLHEPVIKVKYTEGGSRIVRDCLTEITNSLIYYFNIYTEEERCVSIVNNQLDKELTTDEATATPITITFDYYDEQGIRHQYIKKTIFLYLSESPVNCVNISKTNILK